MHLRAGYAECAFTNDATARAEAPRGCACERNVKCVSRGYAIAASTTFCASAKISRRCASPRKLSA